MEVDNLQIVVSQISSAVRRISYKYCFLLQINDIVGEFEQEKFEMQKHHTGYMYKFVECSLC